MFANTLGSRCHGGTQSFGNAPASSCVHDRTPFSAISAWELLLVVRHARRQRRDMPVHMGIALLTTQAQQIRMFNLHSGLHSPRDPMHQTHQPQKGILAEIAHHMSWWICVNGRWRRST